MIEEAAGTRMYESKKTSAQKTIEKKDAKLREIEMVLLLACTYEYCGLIVIRRVGLLFSVCTTVNILNMTALHTNDYDS